MHRLDLGKVEHGIYAHGCRMFKFNCHSTDDGLNFIGSNIAWGEPVGELREGNVPGVKLGAGLLSRST